MKKQEEADLHKSKTEGTIKSKKGMMGFYTNVLGSKLNDASHGDDVSDKKAHISDPKHFKDSR